MQKNKGKSKQRRIKQRAGIEMNKAKSRNRAK